ncbi:IclR family transcriptional regulator [Chondromyces apiculatus]|uniref:IclR family transcriptional regulator n=1 Tax=Chondromyces apiculatus TaxID=51 RepID=UPI001E4752E0|nr:IclR family transcriptional regulator [Chondromyces apiculatus]
MLRSVTVALQVFEVVAMQQPIGVSEISRRLGMSKSTVQRCLVTLGEAGWIRPEVTAGPTRWVITSKSFGIGRRVGNSRHLRTAALPVLERLRDATGAPVELIVPEGREGVLIERVATAATEWLFLPPGLRAPLHVRADGKVILARLPEEDLEAYLGEGLEMLTRQTVTDPMRLRRELASIRARGWAASIDELVDGVSTLASAVVDLEGRPLAAVSLHLPSEPFQVHQARNRKLVVAAGIEIGARLDGREVGGRAGLEKRR